MVAITRRQFIRGAAAAGVLIAGGASLSRPSEIVVERVTVPVPRLDPALDGFSIAQLSDLHYDAHFDAHMIQAAVERVNALKPDLIALTGDFVSVRIYKDWDRKSARNATPCAALLSKLRARLGIFAVLGNHDFRTDPKIVAASIEGAGIPVLRNQAAEIHAAAGLWIAGVNDILNGADDLDQALANIPRGATTILLAHEPDFADDVAQQSAVQLQLSGHSHGGQIRIPVPGGVYAPYLPELGRKYPWGLRNVGGLTLYTNRGIGTLYVPSRVYCPPEITLLKLTRRAAD